MLELLLSYRFSPLSDLDVVRIRLHVRLATPEQLDVLAHAALDAKSLNEALKSIRA